MKYIVTVILSMILLAATVPTTYAQVPMAICNENSGLSWRLNTEEDMSHYTVYASNSPIDRTVDNTGLRLMDIPHEPSTAVDDETGNKVVRNTLNSTLSEGPKYFVVSASDKVGNESELSQEVRCD